VKGPSPIQGVIKTHINQIAKPGGLESVCRVVKGEEKEEEDKEEEDDDDDDDDDDEEQQ
jgi:hypothetical protein